MKTTKKEFKLWNQSAFLNKSHMFLISRLNWSFFLYIFCCKNFSFKRYKQKTCALRKSVYLLFSPRFQWLDSRALLLSRVTRAVSRAVPQYSWNYRTKYWRLRFLSIPIHFSTIAAQCETRPVSHGRVVAFLSPAIGNGSKR